MTIDLLPVGQVRQAQGVKPSQGEAPRTGQGAAEVESGAQVRGDAVEPTEEAPLRRDEREHASELRQGGGAQEEEVATDPAALIEERLEQLHQQGYLRELRMHWELDAEEKSVTLKILDARTEEVVRSIPPEEQTEFARKMEEFLGLLFDESA